MGCVSLPRTKFEFHTVKKNELTTKVLWKLDETPPNIIFPTTVAIVGRINAPHRTLVADTGSRRGAGSAGVLKPVSEMKGIALCSHVLYQQQQHCTPKTAQYIRTIHLYRIQPLGSE